MITIELVKNQKDMTKYLYHLRKIPFVNETPETMLGKCLVGRYGMMLFSDDEVPIALVVFENIHPLFMVVGMYAKNNYKKIEPVFREKLVSLNYTTVEMLSDLPEEAYTRLIGNGCKKVYTKYKKHT